VGNRLALTDWLLDGELARLERELGSIVERFREASRRSLLRKLQELPPRAFGELMAVLLERAGLLELTAVKRPGAHGAELHLGAKAVGPAGELRTAIVVRRDGREIGRERVTELRGALHHYGPASGGWLVTTGQVLSGAREEAAAPGAAPVTLVDGAALARLCEQHGVAVARTRVTLPLPDLDLLDTLRGG
jgi:restriction endonuclease Mrr